MREFKCYVNEVIPSNFHRVRCYECTKTEYEENEVCIDCLEYNCHRKECKYEYIHLCYSCVLKRCYNSRYYISCHYKDRENIKLLGGRWDGELKCWYIPEFKMSLKKNDQLHRFILLDVNGKYVINKFFRYMTIEEVEAMINKEKNSVKAYFRTNYMF